MFKMSMHGGIGFVTAHVFSSFMLLCNPFTLPKYIRNERFCIVKLIREIVLGVLPEKMF